MRNDQNTWMTEIGRVTAMSASAFQTNKMEAGLGFVLSIYHSSPVNITS
jgi:hypothetical protein